MPNLLNFIKRNGTLDAGDHTVLISHTANDILTTETGLYSDHHGIFVANNFGVFGPGSGLASIYFPSSFFYWTDKVLDITPATDDSTYALTTPSGDNGVAAASVRNCTVACCTQCYPGRFLGFAVGPGYEIGQ